MLRFNGRVGLRHGLAQKGVCRAAGVSLALAILLTPALAFEVNREPAFKFESVTSLDDMIAYIQHSFSLGASREEVRRAFVKSGNATLKVHPTRAGVEKYLYDINLCDYYVWRWNISVDYDEKGKLLQAYVNGEPVFAAGPQKHDVREFPGKPTIFKLHRQRPEAVKGEKELSYVVYDGDSNLQTPDDELAIGGGPSRADPGNMGSVHMYTSVDPWRSIFDHDAAQQVVEYKGSCASADKVYAEQKAHSANSTTAIPVRVLWPESRFD
jgi:hypothetical protein